MKTRCNGVGNGNGNIENDNKMGFGWWLSDLWKTMWKTFWDWGMWWEIAWGSVCGKVGVEKCVWEGVENGVKAVGFWGVYFAVSV